MTIAKYLHSCLLFEKNNYKLLFDPGVFSFAEGLVEPEQFKDVSAIIITHIHPDHLDRENLEKIVELSGATIYTVAQVAEELRKEGLECNLIPENKFNIGPFELKPIIVAHELIMDNPLPQMFAFVIDDIVLHPVDSFDDKLFDYAGIELLILPVMAPFTTEPRVAAFADRIKPKQILPVHDGYAKEFFLKQRYQAYNNHFEKQGIKFHQPMSPGDFIEILKQQKK